MAVYSIRTGGKICLQMTRQFKVFDTVSIILRNGNNINGEIVFIEKDKVHITGPYMPIETIKLEEIIDIIPWNPPEEWK